MPSISHSLHYFIIFLSLTINVYNGIQWGVPKIHVVSVVASETGIKAISKTFPDVEITVATVDKELTEDGILLPGLGDAGDRLFGTPMIDDDEALLHPSKRRKTSMDESSVN